MMDEKVTLHYLGHSAFLWVMPCDTRLLIDPYGNHPNLHWFLKPCPRVDCDIVVVTHPHFDHNAVDGLQGQPTLFRGPFDLRGEGFSIRGIMAGTRARMARNSVSGI